ncbi:hypothetical protein D7M11_07765 [Paenibacillus ginsengarvi]|uniref:Uncharacterized protein n=1 Tax=Paenibacillus ginsengarvi TaxID=400777 RepID=A0A3B0CJJ5_9BACL|nr:hypothetical protein D7M11_07765 [Paenibacillus ginsengarvi]
MSVELYHFSEEPNIEVFRPRPAPAFPHLPPVVFALDRERSPHYFFPRDCPRVIYWKADWTTEEDAKAFLANTVAEKVVVVESGWLDRIRETKLYMYTFAGDSFEMMDGSAGYYVSRETVVPVKVELVGDLLGKLLAAKLDVRFTSSLHPIRESVIASTIDFSIIRFRNAAKA